MLIKLETKSNRVKGLCFHPKRPWILASLHNGVIQLWDYRMGTLIDTYEEHEGPVRGVDFHPTQPLFVTGGDDYKVKVWNYKLRRCIFTLTGHLDYIRTVQFHHEQPWIVSSSDDQTIRIWNWQSRQCIAVLTGHNHYVMCAKFHPRDDLIVSASLDQTVRVWDVSGLKKKAVVTDDMLRINQFNQEIFGTNDVMVKYILEGHERGVNWADFHPTQPLVVSAADDRTVKIWRVNETRAWETETLRGHVNNVSCAVFHPKKDLVISNSEDKSIRVWDFTKNTFLHSYRKDNDRFWIVAVHPTQNLIAAGHDSGFMVFKFERERPAFETHGNELYYFREKYLKRYDFSSNVDASIAGFKKSWPTPPLSLSFSKRDRFLLITSATDGGSWDLFKVPSKNDDIDFCKQLKKGSGKAAVFTGPSKFAVLEKDRTIVVRNIKDDQVKEISPPVPLIDNIFKATPGRILLRTEEKVYLYDFEQQSVIAEVPANYVKYAVWSDDMSRVALLSKHGIVICDNKLTQLCSLHETIRVKGGAFDENGVFIYTTLNHMKYCLPNGDAGTIKTLEAPIYIAKVKSNAVHYIDREGHVHLTYIDATEYRFKLALLQGKAREVKAIINKSKILGDSIISYLQKKGHPEVAMKFVKDDLTKFNLAIECGNIDVAVNMAHKLKSKDCWERVGNEALQQGNLSIAETAYQRTNAFEKLSFLYLITGNIQGLQMMLKIAGMRKDVMSKFHNALFLGDIESRIRILEEVGQVGLAYATAKTHGYDELAEELKGKLEVVPEINTENAKLIMPPTPIFKQGDWPLLAKREEVKFDTEEDEEEEQIIEDIPQTGWGGITELKRDDEMDDELENVEKTSEIQEDELGIGTGWTTLGELEEMKETLIEKSTIGFEPPNMGRSAMEYWPENSSLAADHIAAGSFQTAMDILNRTAGIINFEPLKPYFMSIYIGAKSVLPLIPSLPSIDIPLQRNVSEREKHFSLPSLAISSLEELQNSYKDAIKLTTSGRFDKACQMFLSILHSIPLLVVESKKAADELKELLMKCTDYVSALQLELKRQEEKNPKRSCELAAYFTHCKLNNVHVMLSLVSAMTICYKSENYLTAAGFAKRLMRMSPPKQMADQAQFVLKKADEKASNKYDLEYDEKNPFVLCNYSLKPIYAGSDFIKCPYCAATYSPEHKDKLCQVCKLGRIGLNVPGLQSFQRIRK